MHLLYSRLRAKQLQGAFPFTAPNNTTRSPFAEEKAEAQRRSVTYLSEVSPWTSDSDQAPAAPASDVQKEHEPDSSHFSGRAPGRKVWDQGSPVSDRDAFCSGEEL